MFERLGRCHGCPAAALSSGRRCNQRHFADTGVSASSARIFDKVFIRPLQLSQTSTEYKRHFQRVVRCLRDDPSIFAIEQETLARRAFIDIDISIQLQMIQNRFMECALCRHLDSLGPNTPMADIVDCCRVWESHRDVETEPRTSADRRPARAVCQVMADEQIPTASPETETLENIIRRFLPTPALPAPPADQIPAD